MKQEFSSGNLIKNSKHKENPFSSNPLEKNKSLKSIHDQSSKTGGNLLTGKNL